jgi:hypothetical protein
MERDLGGRHAVALGDLPQERVLLDAPRARHSAQRAVREQQEALGLAPLGDPAAQRLVLPGAQLDLDGRDLGDAQRFLELAGRHVAEPDALHQPVATQGGQRAHAGGERHPRVRSVELVEVDALDPQRAQARLARAGQVPGPAVGDPAAVGAGQAALGRDPDARPVARPGRERPGDQPLVVARLALVERVRVGRVEERDPGVERRVERGQAARLVPAWIRGEAHAPDREGGLRHGPRLPRGVPQV